MTHDERQDDLHLQKIVREAYAADTECPSVEVFHDAAEGRLTEAELTNIRAHAGTCPACATELELAREFAESGPDDSRQDLDYVMTRLDTVRPWASGPITTMRRQARWRTPLALAASVLIAIGAWRFMDFAPSLPDAPDTDVMRGTSVDAVAPLGDVADAPENLEWLSVDFADHYQVSIRAVDDSLLWQAEFGKPPAAIPDDVQITLHPGVTYYWEVTARGDAGELLARSTRTQFRVLPGSAER